MPVFRPPQQGYAVMGLARTDQDFRQAVLPPLRPLVPVTAGPGGIAVNAQEAERPEYHAHQPMAEIGLQELIGAAAWDDGDAIFAALLHRVL